MTSRNNQVKHHAACSPWLVLIAALSFSSAVFAEDSTATPRAQDLINEMSRASRQLNYDGIFVYSRGARMDTMRIIHKSDSEGEHERMVSLTGHAREVIRDNKSVTCIFPDNQAVMVEKSRPRKFVTAKLPEPIEKVADYYSFSVAGRDRVAGRSTWVINIKPKDDFRYGFQLWVDEETKLLMKSELKDISGKPIEQILFTQLQVVDHIPDRLLKPAISGKGYTWYYASTEELPLHSATHVWSVMDLPAGFVMNDYEKQSIDENSMPVEHLIYSDGLATVSVFIEKVEDSPDVMRGASRMGGVNTFATYSSGYQVTAVGEVPQKTVQLMANSVIRNK